MIVYIYGILLICLFLIEISFNVKLKNILPVLFIIFLVITMGTSVVTIDENNYLYSYNNNEFTRDMGFGVLMNIANNIGLDYYGFKLLITILGFLLINHTASKYLDDSKYYYLLYFIYPFFFNAIQIRNFFAMSVLVFAVPYIIDKNKSGKIKFLLLTILGGLVHKTIWLYLPLVFFNKLDKKKIIKYIIILTSFAMAIIGINKPLLSKLITILASMGVLNDMEGVEGYLAVKTQFGWIIFWIIQLISFGLVYYGRNIIKNRKDNELYISEKKDIKNIRDFVDLTYYINIYMFIFLPFYVLSSTFSRLLRIAFLINNIVFTLIFNITIREKGKHKDMLIIFDICVLALYVGLFVFYFVLNANGWMDTIVGALFKTNIMN